MPETCVWFLGQERPLEEGMATHSNILAWKITWTEKPSLVDYGPWGHKESDKTEAPEHAYTQVTITTVKIQDINIYYCWCSLSIHGKISFVSL